MTMSARPAEVARIEITLGLNGMPVPVTLDEHALRAIAAASVEPAAASPLPYLTIPEAAELLRCSRQRIDDLLSQRRLERIKEGRRTLVRRDEIERWLKAGGE
jgi:excisionase family DNA binding protein